VERAGDPRSAVAKASTQPSRVLVAASLTVTGGWELPAGTQRTNNTIALVSDGKQGQKVSNDRGTGPQKSWGPSRKSMDVL
jgi:hypothetical protein